MITLQRAFLPMAVVVALLATALAIVATPGSADAHPLGNFTINRYSRIEVYSDVIRVNYILDMAEVPTLQESSSVDANGSGDVSDEEAAAYAQQLADELATGITLTIDGEAATLAVRGASVAFPEGQGGLDTTRLHVSFETGAPDAVADITYLDTNYGDRLGWKEVVVSADTGAILSADAPTDDVSAGLTEYPGNLLSSPLNVTSAVFTADPAAATAAPAPEIAEPVSEAAVPTGGFVGFINVENVTLSVVLLAVAAAFAFGALHALEPGHGKTIVAAYFVGIKGSLRQALLLGLIIAVTHSVGVLAIGLLVIFGSQWVLPEHLYPWLSLASGLMVIALGLRLIAARGGGDLLHRLSHALPFGHKHDHHAPTIREGEAPPWKTLVALGLADGLTPSPSAVVVLLAAVALDRIVLGVGLIAAFSLGLAATLAGVSVGLLVARRLIDRTSARLSNTPIVGGMLSAEGTIMRVAPLGGAVVMLIVGTVLTVQALGQPGLPL